VELDAASAARAGDLAPGPYVMLAVSDTGSGMSADVLEHLFEPFFTTKGAGHGTGLGLATVYGIVTQSGGHVSVDSELDHGSTFKVYLPRVESAAPRRPAAATPPPARGRETILVVEDESEVRELIREILEAHGYEVLDAAGYEAALGVSDDHPGPIALVVTDVIMPGRNGRELAAELSRRRPALRVLYMSGYTDEVIARQGILERGVAFLPKPFAPVGLAAKVREVLDGAAAPTIVAGPDA
jgi:two-component system cell cycle sensor histidine kinase/response regulator CckA